MPTELIDGYSLLQSFQYVIRAKYIEVHLQLRQSTEKIKLKIIGYSSLVILFCKYKNITKTTGKLRMCASILLKKF